MCADFSHASLLGQSGLTTQTPFPLDFKCFGLAGHIGLFGRCSGISNVNPPFLRKRPPSPSPRLFPLPMRSARSARLASADFIGASHHSLLLLSAVPGVPGVVGSEGAPGVGGNEDNPCVGGNPDRPGVGGKEKSPLRGPFRYLGCSSSMASAGCRKGVGGKDLCIVVVVKVVSLLEADEFVSGTSTGIETLKKYPRGRPSAVSSLSGGV